MPNFMSRFFADILFTKNNKAKLKLGQSSKNTFIQKCFMQIVSEIAYNSQFHQCSICVDILSPKNYKAKLKKQEKSCAKQFYAKNLLVKCL